jgi:hypothetical protein
LQSLAPVLQSSSGGFGDPPRGGAMHPPFG